MELIGYLHFRVRLGLKPDQNLKRKRTSSVKALTQIATTSNRLVTQKTTTTKEDTTRDDARVLQDRCKNFFQDLKCHITYPVNLNMKCQYLSNNLKFFWLRKVSNFRLRFKKYVSGKFAIDGFDLFKINAMHQVEN